MKYLNAANKAKTLVLKHLTSPPPTTSTGTSTGAADYGCTFTEIGPSPLPGDENLAAVGGCDEDTDPDIVWPRTITNATAYGVFAGIGIGSTVLKTGACTGIGTTTLHCPVTVPKGDTFAVIIAPGVHTNDKVQIIISGSKGPQTLTITCRRRPSFARRLCFAGRSFRVN